METEAEKKARWKAEWDKIHEAKAARARDIHAALHAPCERRAFEVVAQWPYDGPCGDGWDYAGEIINDLAHNGYRIVPADTIDALAAALTEARDHIRGVTGSDDRQDSDSADIVRTCDAALALARGGK